MVNRERPEQGQPEAGSEGLKEKYRKYMDAVKEQAGRMWASAKEKYKDTDFKEYKKYIDSRHRRKYVQAAFFSLVSGGAALGVRSLLKKESAPEIESQPVAAASAPEETEPSPKEGKTIGEIVDDIRRQKAEARQEALGAFSEKKAKSDKIAEEFKKSDKEAEEIGRERIRRAFEALPEKPEAEEAPAEKEMEELEEEPVEESKEEEVMQPEIPQAPDVAQELTPQENTDIEMSKIEERMIIEGLPKDVTFVKMPGDWFAMDTGAIGTNEYRASDEHCYKVTPEVLEAIKKLQNDYSAKIKNYVPPHVLNRRPGRFDSIRASQLKQESEKDKREIRAEKERKIKNLIKECEKIDETSPWLVPEPIKRVQRERLEQREKVFKAMAQSKK